METGWQKRRDPIIMKEEREKGKERNRRNSQNKGRYICTAMLGKVERRNKGENI